MRRLRLTPKTRLILGVLLAAPEAAPLYGYEIQNRTGIPAGQVYPILKRLADAELIASVWGEPGTGRPARRYVRLLPAGRELAKSLVEPSTAVGVAQGRPKK